MEEVRNRIMPVSNNLNYSGFSERGNFISGGDLTLYLVVLLFHAAGNVFFQDG